ncbi:4-trimethylaminobutyraldehyde dehydrogenase-like [Argiope bruennichi]|uniref:4-trimethylaminobutyraldehyde dehydrogenase-like n=1 Tax=Argiope bruennichi TaxID=94029 RepID=UPI00249489F9|nr:4-trimethylaminobutyraldehyde dehydrogenase-like [Argiope bruennichi]XP_055947673.1 4-trimethylaminobutyraldehyde dehydrogenase-like [Argiope bruennichi]
MNKVSIRFSSTVLQNIKRFYTMELKKPFNYLNGKRHHPLKSLRAIANSNPATGEFLFNLPCSSDEDVDQAVKSCKEAFLIWSKKCPRERGQVLLKAAQKIREKLENLACCEVIDTGKPIWEARVDIDGCADVFEYFGGIAATISGTHHMLSDGNFAIVQREPLGVVAGIGAWNYPFQVMSWKVAPALVCGNTFIYKPSEFTPITSVLLAEILAESGLPPGAVNIVQGSFETGEFICQHPGISKVTFTGSVETGKKIIKSCADTMKKVTMELGGKSALIVFSDCDIVNAVKATLLGNFLTQGEVCSNCTRVYVQRPILNKFIDSLVNATKKLKIGDPFEEDTKVGAVINEKHGDKIMDFINIARKEGATVAYGGNKIVPQKGDLKGFFISPCVLTNCTDDMTVVKTEIFGSVVSVLPFDNEDEAIARANALPYGLAAGVMTKDIQRGHRVANSLQAGIVWINNYNIFPPEVPFGGYKLSGYGRENGQAAINDFSQLKTVYVEMNNEIDCPLYG